MRWEKFNTTISFINESSWMKTFKWGEIFLWKRKPSMEICEKNAGKTNEKMKSASTSRWRILAVCDVNSIYHFKAYHVVKWYVIVYDEEDKEIKRSKLNCF